MLNAGFGSGLLGFPSWLNEHAPSAARMQFRCGQCTGLLGAGLLSAGLLGVPVVTTATRYALLVEDDLLVAMVAVDALDELGFRVLEAPSAARALELAQAHQGAIAFAVVDLGLPDRPGEELVRELRSLYPTLPIIIASGKGAGAVDGGVRALANIAFITKPYNFDDLRGTIERVSSSASTP
jgi:DNA-binding NtrC family response regulator